MLHGEFTNFFVDKSWTKVGLPLPLTLDQTLEYLRCFLASRSAVGDSHFP